MVDAVAEGLFRKYFWWVEPSDGATDRLIQQLLQLGTYEDVRAARAIFGDDAFRRALHTTPAGALDARSWVFWHRFFRIEPIPPLPERPLPWDSSRG